MCRFVMLWARFSVTLCAQLRAYLTSCIECSVEENMVGEVIAWYTRPSYVIKSFLWIETFGYLSEIHPDPQTFNGLQS